MFITFSTSGSLSLLFSRSCGLNRSSCPKQSDVVESSTVNKSFKEQVYPRYLSDAKIGNTGSRFEVGADDGGSNTPGDSDSDTLGDSDVPGKDSGGITGVSVLWNLHFQNFKNLSQFYRILIKSSSNFSILQIYTHFGKIEGMAQCFKLAPSKSQLLKWSWHRRVLEFTISSCLFLVQISCCHFSALSCGKRCSITPHPVSETQPFTQHSNVRFLILAGGGIL